MVKRPNSKIERILQRLNTTDAGAAWVDFIDRYSAVIMKVLRQFEYGQDRANECYMYVCEKLCEDQFKRLQKFNPHGRARFSNWLATIVFNLCVDWHRSEFGRATILPAITGLPALDQLVYRHCYVLGTDRETCYETLKADFPELKEAHISSSLARIHGILTPRQRWQLGVRMHRRSASTPVSGDPIADFIPHPGEGPDSLAQAEEEATVLLAAMSRLSTEERLLLHLRFQEGLSFKRIAQIQLLGNPHRARRHVRAALKSLAAHLEGTIIDTERQK